jgi:predicted MFS family arabinose efflux permease
MLAVLFLVRTTMALTFQALGALAPLAGPALGVDHVAMGGLIGLYWLPGIFLALPAGLLAGRIGAKRLALASLVLLALGSVLLARSGGYAGAALARLVEGCGNALLSVLISAMVAEWFRGRELSTALGIIFDSWSFGLAATIAALPLIAAWSSWPRAVDATGVFCLAAALLLALAYRAPPSAPRAALEPPRWRLGEALRRHSLLPSAAALLWTTYNAGQLVLLTYAPPLLASRGMSLPAASAQVSLVVWIAMASMPLGGLLADRGGRLVASIAAGCIGAGLAAIALVLGAPPLPAVILAGIFIGLPAGGLFSLPVRASAPGYVGWALGWFMAVYYLLLTAAQWLAGYVRESGGDGAAVLFGAVLLLATALAVPFLTLMQRARAAR